MIAFEPYRDGDIERFAVQPSQADDMANLDWFWFAVESGPTWSMIAPDGEILFIGGFWVHDAGHASIWCLLAENKRHAMIEITRICRTVIAAAKWDRIDMVADRSKPDALRWATLLGFKADGPLPGSDTHDYFIYPRESANG
jgi:hypothetical protein